jgi:hypothetical protein
MHHPSICFFWIYRHIMNCPLRDCLKLMEIHLWKTILTMKLAFVRRDFNRFALSHFQLRRLWTAILCQFHLYQDYLDSIKACPRQRTGIIWNLMTWLWSCSIHSGYHS